ncbi:hypothetical protein OG210_06345 [Streptomyces sp. NBC_00466]|uniref:hypothetical protein n=1 Tax=Streptomyces sp. NBC_00466 TaxID=2903655 RepID=UPI0032538088
MNIMGGRSSTYQLPQNSTRSTSLPLTPDGSPSRLQTTPSPAYVSTIRSATSWV